MAIKFGLPGIKQKPAPKQPAKLTFGDKLMKAIKRPTQKGFSAGLVKKLKMTNKGAGLRKDPKSAVRAGEMGLPKPKSRRSKFNTAGALNKKGGRGAVDYKAKG